MLGLASGLPRIACGLGLGSTHGLPHAVAARPCVLVCLLTAAGHCLLTAAGHCAHCTPLHTPADLLLCCPPQGSEVTVNQAAADLLRKLPGVSEANYRQVMAAAGSLAALADMSLAQLEAAMGSARAAKALRDFLDAPCPLRLG